jgi:mannose-6-phosphate isomerase-like protein (cupin superfamily)
MNIENLKTEEVYSIHEINLSPLQVSDYINHSVANKFWMVISGNGIATLNTVDFTLSPGHTMLVPLGTNHLLANTSNTDILKVLEIRTGNNLTRDEILVILNNQE